MKDPLQIRETPYEILGVPAGADKKAIEAAFRKAFAPGGDVVKVREARASLIDPVERAFTDIFLYNDAFLCRMKPDTASDASLLVRRRMEVARQWENAEKRLFPDYAYIHGLAVLWYWWAVYIEEKKLAAADIPPGKCYNFVEVPSLSRVWPDAISRWVFLINSGEFLEEWFKARGDVITDDESVQRLRGKITGHFTGILNGYKDRYRDRGDNFFSNKYREYGLLFDTEMKAAEGLAANNMKITVNGKTCSVCCGRTMLEKIGLFDAVKEEFSLSCLSKYSNIAALIEKKNYKEAIYAINNLPAASRGEEEVLLLSAKANFERGRQHFALDEYRESKDCWKRAVKTGKTTDEMKKVMVDSWSSRASAISGSDPDTAIGILELALEIVSDTDLKNILSSIYVKRGIGRITTAQKEYESSGDSRARAAARQETEKGVKDLRRAVELNPHDSFASEQLKAAGEIVRGFYSSEILEDAGAKRWMNAADKLEAMIKEEPGNEEAREFHAICCNRWAIEIYESTGDFARTEAIINRGLKYSPYSSVLRENLASLLNSKGVELANEAVVCVQRNNAAKAASLIAQAEAFLMKAVGMEPSNAAYRENLSAVSRAAMILNVRG